MQLVALFIETLAHIYTACTDCNLHCVVVVYIAQTLYLHSGWLPLATCTGGLVPGIALAHILYAQIATCTVMVVHGGGSGVMEVVLGDGSMWWLYITRDILGI